MRVYVILSVCIIFCYNVYLCGANNVCGSLCAQYKNNTYVANENGTWHLSFYYTHLIKTVASLSGMINCFLFILMQKN